jgi:hypothetical protein
VALLVTIVVAVLAAVPGGIAAGQAATGGQHATGGAPTVAAARVGSKAPVPTPAELVAQAGRRSTLGRDVRGTLEDRVVTARRAESRAHATVVAVRGEIDALARTRTGLVAELSINETQQDIVRKERQRAGSDLVDLLQGTLTIAADRSPLYFVDPVEATRSEVSGSLADSAAAHLRDVLRRANARLSALEREALALRGRLALNASLTADAHRRLDDAERALEDVRRPIREIEERLGGFGKGGQFPGLDIDLVVVDAYLRAARRIDAAEPACGVQWWILAAIGLIESNHSRGRTIGPTGDITPRVIGVPLDGSPGLAAIRDSDGGRLDGDTTWDRAVGPMQFIPQTWAALGVDGNDDGIADPHNVYDGAASSAVLLCRARGGQRLDSLPGLSQAAFAYNQSTAYVAAVVAAADRLAQTDLRPPREVVVVTGTGVAAGLPALQEALAARGWRSRVVVGLAPAAVLDLLAPVGDAPPAALTRGSVLVVGDPTWTPAERAEVARRAVGVSRLRAQWVPPAAPDETMARAVADEPLLQVTRTLAVPTGPGCASGPCAAWRDWAAAVAAEVG